MTSDKLFTDLVDGFVRLEISCLLMKPQVHEYVDHDISDLFAAYSRVLLENAVQIFVAFIDETLCRTLVRLYSVPGASLGRAQECDYRIEIVQCGIEIVLRSVIDLNHEESIQQKGGSRTKGLSIISAAAKKVTYCSTRLYCGII